MQEDLCGKSTGVNEISHGAQAQQEAESSGLPHVSESLISSPNPTPASVILPSQSLRILLSSPTTSTPNTSPPSIPIPLPEGPPTQSPFPPEWFYSDPSEQSSNRPSFIITSN